MRTSQFSLLFAFFALLLIAGIAAVQFGYFNSRDASLQNEDTDLAVYECNADGRSCPDGSVVARSGPQCEFTECPGVMPVSGGLETQGVGVLFGRVTLSPVCPVERIPPDPNCAPKAFVTDVSAIHASSGTVQDTTRTTQDGVFVMDLPAGDYILRAKSAQVYPMCGDVRVSVPSGKRTEMDISCDSGIR